MENWIVWDMDGVSVDLYGVDNWLDYLINEDTTPYEIAKPLINIKEYQGLLENLKQKGYKLAITSWLSKNGSDEYNKRVTNAKMNWLKKYNLINYFEEINIVKYGTPKATVTEKLGGYQILVDDELNNRNQWYLGETIDGSQNFIKELGKLL